MELIWIILWVMAIGSVAGIGFLAHFGFRNWHEIRTDLTGTGFAWSVSVIFCGAFLIISIGFLTFTHPTLILILIAVWMFSWFFIP